MSTLPKLRFEEFTDVWSNAELETVTVKVTSGSRDWAQFYSDTGDKFIRMTNLPKRGVRLLLDDMKYVDVPRSGSEGQRTSLNAGDVLISITAELGKIGLVPEGFGVAYINQHTALVRPDSTALNSKYLSQYLATRKSNKRLNRLNDSGAKSGLNLSTIKSFNLVFPSLPEQKKIADFLGAVDDKSAGLRERERLLIQYKKGVMQKIFTQDIRFKADDGSNFPDWETVPFQDIITRHNSGVYKKKELYGTGVKIVGVGDLYKVKAIEDQEFRKVPLSSEEVEQYSLMEGDIIYSESSLVRSGIAKSVYVKANGEGTCFAWHTRRLTVNSEMAISAFIYFYLESSIARKYITSVATQTALTGITTKDYFQTPTCLPDLEEQQKIADFLSAIDAKITAVSAQISQMQDFKKGLLQQMFV